MSAVPQNFLHRHRIELPSKEAGMHPGGRRPRVPPIVNRQNGGRGEIRVHHVQSHL